jgi:cytosine/adenosine deaminase-related metal-dependent hydrolase
MTAIHCLAAVKSETPKSGDNMTTQTLKIQGAKFILTMDPQRRIIRDGSILVEGQRIAHVGKAADLEAVPADRVIDAREMVVTPGLINAHNHVSTGPHVTRGVFPEGGDGYLDLAFAMQRALSEEEQYISSLSALTEMVKNGTTCFLDPGDPKHVRSLVAACETAGCRGIVGYDVIDKVTPWGWPQQSSSEALAVTEQVIQTYHGQNDGRVRAWAMLIFSTDCSEEVLVGAKQLADKYGTGLTFHESHSQQVIDLRLREHDLRPLQYLERIGALGPNVLLAHLSQLSEAEIEVMVSTQTNAVICPTTQLRWGGGMTVHGRLPELLEAGVCVALGGDSGDFTMLDLSRSMYLATTLFKDARMDKRLVPAETALEMGTIQGAKALGWADEIGSLEVGRKADLVLFDTKRPEWRSLFNPVNNLIYYADGRSVHTVMVDGRILVDHYKITFVDEWELLQQAQAIGERLLARHGLAYPLRWPVS